MKKLFALALAVFSANSFAENVLFSGNQTESCELTVNQGGSLNFDSATSFTTVDSYKGEVQVVNNSAGSFSLYTSVPTDFSYKPTDYTGTTTFASTHDMTGANMALGANGTYLANSGTDTVEIVLSGTSDTDYPAGTYQAIVVVSCNAI